MSDPNVDNLTIDLLTWLAQGDRSYEEVMDAWRTSCPRLTVWEDASDRGLVAKKDVQGRCLVSITSAGREMLREHGLSQRAKSEGKTQASPAL